MAQAPPPPPPAGGAPPPPPPSGPAQPPPGQPSRAGFAPRGIGEIISGAFELYRDHWQILVGIVAVVIVPITLIQYFITDELLVRDPVVNVTTTTEGLQTVTVSSSGGWAILAALLATVISAVAGLVLTGAITRVTAGTLVGETPDAGQAFSFGFSKIGPILWVSLIVGLTVLGGFILLIIPGLIFLVMFSVAVPALVVEDVRGTSAMGRSWNLVKTHFWHVVGAYLIAFILAAIVSGIITAIFPSDWYMQGIAGAIGSIITTPFTALVLMLVYVDLRVRTEQLSPERLKSDLAGSA